MACGPHGADELIEIGRGHGGRAVAVCDYGQPPTAKERTDAAAIAWGHAGNLDGILKAGNKVYHL
jgi:hypothetical protein